MFAGIKGSMAAQDTSSRARARGPVPEPPRARFNATPAGPSSPAALKRTDKQAGGAVETLNPDQDASPRSVRKGVESLALRTRTGPNTTTTATATTTNPTRGTAARERELPISHHQDDEAAEDNDDQATVASSTARSYTSTRVMGKRGEKMRERTEDAADNTKSRTRPENSSFTSDVPRARPSIVPAPASPLPSRAEPTRGDQTRGETSLPLIRVQSARQDVVSERRPGRNSGTSAHTSRTRDESEGDGEGEESGRFGGRARVRSQRLEEHHDDDNDNDEKHLEENGDEHEEEIHDNDTALHDDHVDEEREEGNEEEGDEHTHAYANDDTESTHAHAHAHAHAPHPRGSLGVPPTRESGTRLEIPLRRQTRPPGADDTVSMRSRFTMADSETASRRASGNLSSMLDDTSLMGDANSRPMLRIEARYEPPAVGDKLAGTVHVFVREGQSIRGYRHGNAVTLTSYVKLYISQNGSDIKDTKQKTKDHKGETAPKFNERFIFYLRRGMPVDERTRLQITLWERSRLGASHCLGGMSFTIPELAGTVSDWFEVLEEVDGRLRNTVVGDPNEPSLRRQNSLHSQSQGGFGSVASLPTNGKRRHQRIEHYIAQVQELEQRLEHQNSEILELRTDLESARVREQALLALKEDNQHLRMELANYVSEKEKLVKQCKELEGVVAELRDGTLSPPLTTPLRGPLTSSLRQISPPETGSPATSGLAAARARDRHMISTLQSRLGDAHDEIHTLRTYNSRLQNELLRLSPKAMARACRPFEEP